MKKFVSILGSYLGRVGVYFMLVMLVFGFVSLAMASSSVGLVLIWTALLFAVLTGFAKKRRRENYETHLRREG